MLQDPLTPSAHLLQRATHPGSGCLLVAAVCQL